MSTQSVTQDIKKRSTWSILMGILTAALGLFLIAYPLATATVATVLLGWILIIVGVAEFVFALHSQSAGKFFLKALLGVLYVVAGITLAFFPLSGVAALTIVLATLLLVYGGVGVGMAFQLRPVEGWGWILFDSIASIFLGILILARWPSSAVWAIGTLVGVAVLVGGISRIMLAAGVRRHLRVVDRPDLRRAA